MLFFKSLKKLTTKDKNKTPGKVEKFSNFLSKTFDNAILESKTISKKMQDLQKTNYELGMMHLNKGNINEAIFRFKIVRKFWPNNYKAHLNLIYCYFILKKEKQAQKAINILLKLNPKLEPNIQKAREDASFYQEPQKTAI